MKLIRLIFFLKKIIIISIFLTILTLKSSYSFADCSCNPSNYTILRGFEYTAKSCPTEDFDENKKRPFISQSIICRNGVITKESYPTDIYISTKELISTLNYYNMRKIIKNETETHYIAVHKYYQGTVAGVTPTTGVTTVENLNEYCTNDGGLPDQDGDHYPDCLDCDPKNPNLNADCPISILLEANLGPRVNPCLF